MKVGVVTFPGTLDDRDAARAATHAGTTAISLWHNDADLKGVDAFKEKAKAEGIIPMDAKTIGVADRRVGALGETRQIVQWLFRDAAEGKVSDVFDLNDQYVVAVMTGELEKGYKPFEIVKEEVGLSREDMSA